MSNVDLLTPSTRRQRPVAMTTTLPLNTRIIRCANMVCIMTVYIDLYNCYPGSIIPGPSRISHEAPLHIALSVCLISTGL